LIAITMGDPAGVGPELCLRIVSDDALRSRCVPIIFGDATVLRRVGSLLHLSLPDVVRSLDELDAAAESAVMDTNHSFLRVRSACRS
jgi:4-hydroxythreonine-4-phosphate dehydrogenase